MAIGVQVPCKDDHPGGGEEEVWVHPIQDFLEGVEVPVLPTLARLGMRRLHPLAEAPTWVSPQGFAGALDHIFLRTPSEAAQTTEVRSSSSFPSDHLPVTATLHDLPPAPQLVCPSKKGRFPIPREPLASQLRTLNDTFSSRAHPAAPGRAQRTA